MHQVRDSGVDVAESIHSGSSLAAGIYNLGFAAFHIFFWRLFGWPRTLAPSGALNTAVTQTLNIVLTYVFVAAGGSLLWYWAAGRDAPLLMTLGAGFWLFRAALQPLLFDMRARASQFIFMIFLLGAAIHAVPLFTYFS